MQKSESVLNIAATELTPLELFRMRIKLNKPEGRSICKINLSALHWYNII